MNSRQIQKLHEKKHRKESGLFLVEGTKNVVELLASDFVIRELYATKEFAAKHAALISGAKFEGNTPRAIVVAPEELASFGTLGTNNGALAVVKQKKISRTADEILTPIIADGGYLVALEGISDPGNLGTIIRIADWFGAKGVITSLDTTDAYSPKAVAAAMGSFTRISVDTMDLSSLFALATKKKIPIIGATLDGANITTASLPRSGIIVMGSESHGLSKPTNKLLSHKITIPGKGGAESLNVAVATGIILHDLLK